MELDKDPRVVEIRRCGGFLERCERRNNNFEVGAGEGTVAFGDMVGGVEVLRVGDGNRSLPMRALSDCAAMRRRLCIEGRCSDISSWMGDICLSTSTRSICSESPSVYDISYNVTLSWVEWPVILPVKVSESKRFVIVRPTRSC